TQVPVLDALLQSKFFEVDQYPTATFESTSVRRIGLSDHYRVKGQLTLHGVINPVTLNVTLNKTGNLPMLKAPAIGFEATTTVRRSAFGLGQYVPLVSDRIRINGLAVEFLMDASGSVPYANRAGSATAEEIHRVFTVVEQSNFAAVLTTDEWLACLADGTQPERDNIHATHQRALAERKQAVA